MSKTTGIREPQVVLTPKSPFGIHTIDYDMCEELIAALKNLGVEEKFHIELVRGEES